MSRGRSYVVSFRGGQRAVIVTKYLEDFETNACEIEWMFEGLAPDEHDALNVSDAEEDAIIDQIIIWESERARDDS